MDVYGRGALLHRLLTGRTPQASTESTDTPRPSLLVRSADDAYHRPYVPLKNDLDRVLLKDLAEEPQQRYATAQPLADDLRCRVDSPPLPDQQQSPRPHLRQPIPLPTLDVAASMRSVTAAARTIR